TVSSTAIPPGNCPTHGYHGCVCCPRCSSSAIPPARLSPSRSHTDTQMVAALYIEKGGVYWDLPGVDPWDEERDAGLYEGPWPVVAHPPCARWSRLAGFTEYRFGLKRGDDGGCFEHALRSVREFGGVLEHPAHSDAFKKFGLPRPTTSEGWTLGMDGGASCYLEQGRYGLPVKKATCLYPFAVDLPNLPPGSTHDRQHN